MNILEFIITRSGFWHLYGEYLSDLQDDEGDLRSIYLNRISEYAAALDIQCPKPAFVYAQNAAKETLSRKFDELFAAQNNLVKVTYRVSEGLFSTYSRVPLGSDNQALLTDIRFRINDNFPNVAGIAFTALTDKYALGFTWNFNSSRANDKRLFFETLKYIHGAWRDTFIGAQIADGEGLDRELQWIETESGELQFSVVLNAYQYCKLIGFSKSFNLFNAALIDEASGVPVFVQREKELFWTEKVECL